MTYSFIPAGAVLTISGPMHFHLVPHSEGTFVPAAQPQATPTMAPTFIPAPMPQSTPTLWPSIDYSIPGKAPPLAAPPKAPVAVPSMVPTPDPHIAQMANYTAARYEAAAHAQMARERDEQMAAYLAQGFASPSAGAAMNPFADLDPAGTKEKYLREVVAAADAKGDADPAAKKAKEAAEAAIEAIDATRKAKHEAAKLTASKADATPDPFKAKG